MAEECCENSTDREFEDYFAANAPVDALSKMEKAVQLLETIDTEELRRTEQAMVSSALKSLRHSLQRWHSFRDEDMAGDDASGDRVSSEGEKRDTRDNGHCNGGPSPAASELESAAYITGDGTVEGGALELHWPDEIEGRTYQSLPEPLVRPDQFFDRLIEIVEEHRHRAEDAAAAGNEKERYACESVADVIYDAVMQWKLQIKETQGGSSE